MKEQLAPRNASNQIFPFPLFINLLPENLLLGHGIAFFTIIIAVNTSTPLPPLVTLPRHYSNTLPAPPGNHLGFDSLPQVQNFLFITTITYFTITPTQAPPNYAPPPRLQKSARHTNNAILLLPPTRTPILHLHHRCRNVRLMHLLRPQQPGRQHRNLSNERRGGGDIQRAEPE